MVLGALNGIFGEEVKTKRVLVSFEFGQQTVAQPRPFLLPDLAFKHGFLYAHAVILACLRNTAQAPLACFVHRRNVIRHKNEHVMILGQIGCS